MVEAVLEEVLFDAVVAATELRFVVLRRCTVRPLLQKYVCVSDGW